MTILIFLSLCACQSKSPYKDNFPIPCTPDWYTEIEKVVTLSDTETGLPRRGSNEWLNLLDRKYTISTDTGTSIGDIEWCHQVHQKLIGL